VAAPTVTSATTGVTADSAASARSAGLRYVSDARPGIRREQAEEGVAYLSPDGQRITDEAALQRIRKLAVPPAWTDVWICPHVNGHLQASGRDARGRNWL
jgi:DNA topoisomerase I